MVGISGAGKSTWIKKSTSNLDSHVYKVICPDTERKRLTGDISNQECSPTAFFNCNRYLKAALDNPAFYYIFWDATNLDVKSLNYIVETVKASDFEWGVNVVCFEDSRDWKLCQSRVESDLKGGVDRSNSIKLNEETGKYLIQNMSERYMNLVDNNLNNWCVKNNVTMLVANSGS